MSIKTILSWNQAKCIGIPLEHTLKRFEQEAGLGSNTGSYSLFDCQRFYLKPLFKALEKVQSFATKRRLAALRTRDGESFLLQEPKQKARPTI